MKPLPILETAEAPAPERAHAFRYQALGFRPFFLLAGLVAPLLMLPWIVANLAGRPFLTYYGFLPWHGHEMVFGYAGAVIAGFLLTAGQNWTNLPTLKGAPLYALAGLWIAGRLAPFLPLPGAAVAALDLAFFPALAAGLAVPLWRSRNARNYVFVPLLLAMTAANALVHAQALGLAEETARVGLLFGVYVILLMIAVVGGRVIPFFTERALAGFAARRSPWIERAALPTVALVAALGLFSAPPALVAVAAAAAALVHGARLLGWRDRRLWGAPLLWVLHLGYGWMVLGFALQALAALDLVPALAPTHAYGAGAIGVLTYGMMARVALGHTGRPLAPAKSVSLAFVLINLAAAARVGAAVFPAYFRELLGVSGSLWIASFAIFVVVYAPILVRPRPDGRPG